MIIDDARGQHGGRMLLAGALIAVLGTGLWAWSRGLNGPYLFDDHVTPLGDPASQSLTAWTHDMALGKPGVCPDTLPPS